MPPYIKNILCCPILGRYFCVGMCHMLFDKHQQSPMRVWAMFQKAKTKKKKMQAQIHPVSGIVPTESSLEEDSFSPYTSSDEESEERLIVPECHDDRARARTLVISGTITCVSIVSLLIILDTIEAKLSPNSSSYNGMYLGSAFKRRLYTPGETAEKFLLCTVGANATERTIYPPDGLCNWIVYTHVSYDAHNESLISYNAESWRFFLQMRSQYTLSGLLPSHEWANFILDARQARTLNRTLKTLRMVGLAFLNVRIAEDQAPKLTAALSFLASVNPGMFLVLGATFNGLSDRTASHLVPSFLLDQLVTPLSVFVLETHLPSPGAKCVTGFPTAMQPAYGQRDESLTFRGVRAFLEQPVLRYTYPATLARCVSVTAGVLVFHVLDGHRAVLGAPCSHWSLEKLAAFCGLPTVSVNVDAQAVYGNRTGVFFSFESHEHMSNKMTSVLHSLFRSELPTCVAVYSLDLDAPRGLCPFERELQGSLAYTAYSMMQGITRQHSSAEFLFVPNATEGSLNSTL